MARLVLPPGGVASQPLTAYLVEDADDDGVQEPDARHTHQAEQEEVGLAVELEVGGLWVQDGAHQLPFRSAEAWIPKERIRREACPASWPQPGQKAAKRAWRLPLPLEEPEAQAGG